MAKISLLICTNIFFIVLIMPALIASSKFYPLLKNQKLTHLHFFYHDMASGNNQSVVVVANAPNATSPITFGSTSVIDDRLTSYHKFSSKQVGRAQGIYSLASLPSNELAIVMVMNFVFTEGKYNGSTLSLLGRNAALKKVREMPIIGGTGRFRFARGCALAKTYFFNISTGNAIVEYNVYILS